MNRPKRWKYLVGLLAALVLCLAMGMTAFAATEDSEKIPFKVEASVKGHDITLSWTPVEGIDQYRVYDRFGREITEEPIMAPEFTDDTTEPEALTYVIAGVDCSTIEYRYVVKGFVLEEVEIPSDDTTDTEDGANADDSTDADDSANADDGASADDSTDADNSADADDSADTDNSADAGDGTNADAVNPDDAGTADEGTAPAAEGETEDTDADDTDSDPAVTVEVVEKEVYAASVTAKVWINMNEPVISSCKFTKSNQITVVWRSSTNVEGYNVYRKTGSGAWVYLATVTGTTYTDNSVKLGTDYTYRIRGVSKCCKNLSTYDSTGSTASYLKTTTVTSVTAPTSSGVKAVWNAVSGAKGYYVYAQIDGGSWKKVATTTSTSYTYNLSSSYWGKKVGIKVYPYCTEYTALASNTKSTVFQPAAPTLKSAKAVTTKKNTISWSKVSGVKGYKVYRKLPGGSWSCIKTISDASTTSYTDSSVSFGTTYVYTVAGYWQSGSTVEAGYYDTEGLTVKPVVTVQYKKVTDKSSIMYGKTLKLYYDIDGNQIQNVEQFVGSQSKYYLYVNKNKQYVTAYIKDGDYYVPVRAMICSSGALASYTPEGTFSTSAKYRWHELDGPCWGQYCTRIVGGVLFHSVFYNSYNNPLDLSTTAYNKLGRAASHGCVRLCVGDAKWIYDNCSLGTTVVIHSKSGYEPLKKPSSYTVSYSHKWDPTDPEQNWRCKKNGCHDVD